MTNGSKYRLNIPAKYISQWSLFRSKVCYRDNKLHYVELYTTNDLIT
jgi:hypothetical protein